MAKNRNEKKPKAAFAPVAEKSPRVAVSAFSPDSRPSWRLRRLEYEGDWAWTSMVQDDLLRVLAKLQDLETMKWSEILGSDHHEIPIERLCKVAQNRLETLKLDDVDAVLSLRVTGSERVVGIRRDGAVLLLWWDPNHEVCPSEKKNT